MRLDVFLPFLRKPKSRPPGAVRRLLKRLGPTWLSSPVRRLVQSTCLALFLGLFFYVCYPYDAAPSRMWRCGPPTAIDAEGRVTISVDRVSDLPALGRTVYAAEQPVDGEPTMLGEVIVAAVASHQLVVQPTRTFPPERLEALRFDLGGPWTLSESPPGAWPAHYTENLRRKEWLPAESLLVIDPLVSLSTAIASRTWVWSLACAAVILGAALLVPRGFCGWICPLGTVIDLFDWLVGARVTRWRVADDGWWVHIKYYLLTAVMLCSAGGVLISGYFAAIPVVTRGFLFLFDPLQVAYARGWHNVPPINAGHILSLVLFALVLGLGFLKPRFWCKYVCPSGAVFSVGNLLRVTERKVEDSCIHCNKCVEICPFDAIKPDFTTRATDCTLCQSCGGVCPTHAIKFVERWNLVSLKLPNDPPTHETALGRRGFLSLAVGSAAAVLGATGATAVTKALSGATAGDGRSPPVRPPGSLPEREFLTACIRCGECFKACPNNVLQPLGFEHGFGSLWTPAVHANWAGCESSCNACGQVCPTGAIRAIPLEEKRVARIGLAIVNHSTCLPHAQKEACQLCVDECTSAGYGAIEFTRVGTQMDADGNPVEESGFLAPVVIADKCVGCGLCQTRCYAINRVAKRLLPQSAIVIEAGEGKEDRLFAGSYQQLREHEAEQRRANSPNAPRADDYLPDFLKP